MKIRDVTDEYLNNAEPGKGTLAYSLGYKTSTHQNEIQMAEWIHNIFGGDIVLLNEINIDKQKTPDFLWRGKMWDLKRISTEKAANSALRHGLQQIRQNPGGIILDLQKYSFSIDILLEVIGKRMKWYKQEKGMTDILIVADGKLVYAIRYGE